MAIKNKNLGSIVCDVALYFFLTVAAVLCVMPMWHVMMSAISEPGELYASTDFLFLPTGGVSFEAWKVVIREYPIFRGYLNTIFYTISSVCIGLLLTLLGAYVLSEKKFIYSTFLVIIFVIPMFLNAGLMPQYIVNYNLGITNTPFAVILPTAVGGLNILLVRAGIKNVAGAISEAAKIDGAGHMTVLFGIITPLIVPYISMVVMFTVIMQWNSWMLPKIYLTKEVEELWPLALIVNNIVNESQSKGGMSIGVNKLEEYGPAIKMITILLSSFPLLIIYPFIQKYFEKAAIVGAVKG